MGQKSSSQMSAWRPGELVRVFDVNFWQRIKDRELPPRELAPRPKSPERVVILCGTT